MATATVQLAKHAASGVLLSEIETEQVAWLWRGWLALGKLSVLDGDPGLGKSATVLDIAARVSAGREFPDGTRNEVGPGGVVVLSAEDALSDTVKPRLEAAGADLERIASLAMLRDGSGHEQLLSIPEDLSYLEAEIRRMGAKLVVVDPLVAFFSKKVDSHKDQDVRRALAPLAAVADRTGAAVQVVRHLSKGEGKNPVYRGGGSIGIIGAARIGALVATDPKDEDRRVLAPTKNNLAVHPKSLLYTLEEAAIGAVRVLWGGESGYTASELLQSARPDRVDIRREAEAFLVTLLSDGPVPKATVEEEARAANISDSTLRRAKESLGISAGRENEIGGERGYGRWVWRLPSAEATDRRVQSQGVQGAHTRGSERLEPIRTDESPETSLDTPNLQGAQATTTFRTPEAGDHLERGARSRDRALFTVDLVLEEINRAGSVPAVQAELFRRGEITKPNALEQITRAILQSRGLAASDWQKYAPTVEAALIHPLNCRCAECW